MGVTRFWWVRHGPTHAKTMIGWTDRPADLSDRAALARLAAHLPAEAPVISSDLIRAVATADAIMGTRTRMPHDPGLRELHFGAWEDRSFAEIDAETPDLIRAFWEQPGPTRAPGGEGWHDLSARVTRASDRLIGIAADVIVVAHFGAILCQIERATGQSTTDVFARTVDNLSVTVVTHDAGRWHAGPINHLP